MKVVASDLLLPDTNLLVYAFRPECAEHSVTRRWLTDLVEGAAHIGLTSSALVGFVRIATDPRIFKVPKGIESAFRFINAIRSAAGTTNIEPDAAYPRLFDDLVRSHRLRGNDIPDAHLAAVAIEHGAVLATHDRGFDRFPGLRTFDPLA